jgi:hypothetical protein
MKKRTEIRFRPYGMMVAEARLVIEQPVTTGGKDHWFHVDGSLTPDELLNPDGRLVSSEIVIPLNANVEVVISLTRHDQAVRYFFRPMREGE